MADLERFWRKTPLGPFGVNPLHPMTILAKSGIWEGTCAFMLF
jgi:hypothetical protein